MNFEHFIVNIYSFEHKKILKWIFMIYNIKNDYPSAFIHFYFLYFEESVNKFEGIIIRKILNYWVF